MFILGYMLLSRIEWQPEFSSRQDLKQRQTLLLHTVKGCLSLTSKLLGACKKLYIAYKIVSWSGTLFINKHL